jgi:hypothetical protein
MRLISENLKLKRRKEGDDEELEERETERER